MLRNAGLCSLKGPGSEFTLLLKALHGFSTGGNVKPTGSLSLATDGVAGVPALFSVL